MSNIKSLTHILPLAIILLGLVSYNFMNAQWTAAPANPPASNAAAPVNIGTASQVKNGALGVNGLSINSSYPTIAFVDPKVGSRLLYLQPSSNRFYFLGDRNGDGAVVWADDRPEALSIYLGATTSQDFTYVSNQVRAAQYCDAAGLNCFSAVAVAPSVANVDNITRHRLAIIFVRGPIRINITNHSNFLSTVHQFETTGRDEPHMQLWLEF